MKQRIKDKIAQGFVKKNTNLPPAIIPDLYEACKYLYADDVLILAKELKIDKQPIFYKDGRWGKMTVEDLIALVGNFEYADAIGPIKFMGGPQLKVANDKQRPYTMLSGTLLTWIMDQLLYYASIDGPKVWYALDLVRPMKVTTP